MKPDREEEEELLNKLRHFCSFRDRCTSEVEKKLQSLNVVPAQRPGLLDRLRSEKFLDDRRYAGSFARGKFHNNRWGRVKIAYELAGRGLPGNIIREGLEEIDEEEYVAVVIDLIRKKSKEIKDEKKFPIRNKILTFVSRKGFEAELVSKVMNELKI